MRNIKIIVSDIIYQIKDDFNFFRAFYRYSNIYQFITYKGIPMPVPIACVLFFLYSIPYRIYYETIRKDMIRKDM